MRHRRWGKDGKTELQHIHERALSHGGKRLRMFAYATLNFTDRHTESEKYIHSATSHVKYQSMHQFQKSMETLSCIH